MRCLSSDTSLPLIGSMYGLHFQEEELTSLGFAVYSYAYPPVQALLFGLEGAGPTCMRPVSIHASKECRSTRRRPLLAFGRLKSDERIRPSPIAL